jgi:transcriptional regulator with XRE-family HTH domain
MVMAARQGRFTDIDQNIAENLRTHREACNISQEDLAQRMADRGFGFSQATIWKVESGQRPVKVTELVALADALELRAWDLTTEPEAARHTAQLQRANRHAYETWGKLKAAASDYLEAQFQVLFAARDAHDADLAVTELYTSWLDSPAEQAVIEARMEIGQEEEHAQQVDDAVGKVLDALRSTGYEPALRIEDVEIGQGGPLPVWTPARPGST